MKIHELKLTASPDRKRVGRGIGSGRGKTAGRGTKGQNSRTGGGVRLGFEGGQNPLAKRLPKKRGFASLSRITWQVVNLDQLATLKQATVNVDTLLAAGLIKHHTKPVKLLARGKVETKFNVTVQAASATAQTAIEKAGGKVTLIPLARPTKSKSN